MFLTPPLPIPRINPIKRRHLMPSLPKVSRKPVRKPARKSSR